MSRVRAPSIALIFAYQVPIVTTWEAIILGIIQGLTEFLPISSSGHLILAQHLFRMNNLDQYLLFDLVCHIGTLFVILLTFRSEIKTMTTTHGYKIRQLILGTLPLFPLIAILKPIHQIFNTPYYLTLFFPMTAFILYMGIRYGSRATQEAIQKNRWRDALIIGMFQAFAILPGVSRSGSTISAARLLGWSRTEAFTFSFLLAIPAILGGTVVELSQLFLGKEDIYIASLNWTSYLAGFIASFVTGMISLFLLKRLLLRDRLMFFVWYCLLLGIGCSIFFLIDNF